MRIRAVNFGKRQAKIVFAGAIYFCFTNAALPQVVTPKGSLAAHGAVSAHDELAKLLPVGIASVGPVKTGPSTTMPLAGSSMGSAKTHNLDSAPADAIPHDDAAYNDLVNKLTREQYILTLESKNADLKKKIADTQAGGEVMGPSNSLIVAPPASLLPQSNGVVMPPASLPAPVMAPAAPRTKSSDLLRITAIVGVGSHYIATVVDHGVEVSVTEGSTLSNGWMVQSIAPSTVVLIHAHRRRILHVES